MSSPVHNSCPFFLPDDWLVLHPDLSVRQHYLLDVPLDVRHGLHGASRTLLDMLAAGCRYDELCQSAPVMVAEQQIHEALGTLNTIGAIRRTRTVRQHARAAAAIIHHGMIGVYHPLLVHRQPANTYTLGQCIVRATLPIMAAAVVSGGLLLGTGFFALSTIALFSAYSLLLFLASLYVHELVHVRLAQRNGGTCVLVQYGMRLGILHRRQAPALERWSAIGGPLAGMASCLLVAGACMAAQANTAALLGVVVGSFHLGSLLPWYADGAILFTNTKRRRHAPSH